MKFSRMGPVLEVVDKPVVPLIAEGERGKFSKNRVMSDSVKGLREIQGNDPNIEVRGKEEANVVQDGNDGRVSGTRWAKGKLV